MDINSKINKLKYFFAAGALFVLLISSFTTKEGTAEGKKKAVDTVGMSTCLSCHTGYDASVADSPHRTLLSEESRKEGLPAGCEACHGPGGLHIENPGEDIVNFKNKNGSEFAKQCLVCHGANPQISRWEHSDHNKGAVYCNNCHSIHQQEKNDKTGKGKKNDETKKNDSTGLCLNCHGNIEAQFKQASRHPVPEKKMDCSSCHNPHDENTDADVFGSMKQTCVTCHTEKAGPFRFQHDPVAESCLACHKPHGSAADNLQTVRVPNLCVQCHTDALLIHKNPSSATAIKNCLDCHKKIHGSNGSEKLFF